MLQDTLEEKRKRLDSARRAHERKLAKEEKELDAAREAFDKEKARMADVLAAQQEKVTLDVGGKRFCTGMSTLKAFSGSRFESLLGYF